MNRRTAMKVTATAPLAVTNAAYAGQGIDPAVTALTVWKAADIAATNAENKADAESKGTSVEVPAYRGTERAFSSQMIEEIIERNFRRYVLECTDWPEPTPAQIKNRAYAEANPYEKPDGEALKAQFRDNIAHDVNIRATYRVEELRVAERTAYENMIQTPAQSLAGIAAKIRGELLYCGARELADGTLDIDTESPTEAGLLFIMQDAERLAKS